MRFLTPRLKTHWRTVNNLPPRTRLFQLLLNRMVNLPGLLLEQSQLLKGRAGRNQLPGPFYPG